MSDAVTRLVLVVGSPRSGTTWLQTLLGAHPRIATPQETDLFRVYLEPLAEAWDQQVAALRDDAPDRRRKGLPTVVTAAEFDAACRALVDAMTAAVRRHKPGADVVVEKSPGHSMCVPVVARFCPDAHFIHLIRDGRDVATSLIAASQSFGKRFAPGDVRRAAEMWRTRVEGACTARRSSGGYTEIRYEDLLVDPAVLRRGLDACGVDSTDEECAALLARYGFDSMAGSGRVADSIITGGEVADDPRAREEPEGFFRRGTVGGWRDEWGARDRWEFDDVAGDLLVELGYEADRSWAAGAPPRRGRAAAAVRFTSRALRAAASRLDRLAARGA